MPPGAQILSISSSFWKNIAKLYVGTPPGELAPPPQGNPGSATGYHVSGLTVMMLTQMESHQGLIPIETQFFCLLIITYWS